MDLIELNEIIRHTAYGKKDLLALNKFFTSVLANGLTLTLNDVNIDNNIDSCIIRYKNNYLEFLNNDETKNLSVKNIVESIINEINIDLEPRINSIKNILHRPIKFKGKRFKRETKSNMNLLITYLTIIRILKRLNISNILITDANKNIVDANSKVIDVIKQVN
jgi:hypothetical protein